MSANADNPLLQPWETPFGLPPFDRIRPEHFPPAFDHAMAEHEAEIAAIAAAPAPPDFANTIEALERSGRALTRVGRVFHNLTSSATSEALDAIDRDYAPRLAAHHTRIMLDAALFARVDALYRARETLGLAPEQKRLLERYHLRFVRAGALLDPRAEDRAWRRSPSASRRCTRCSARTCCMTRTNGASCSTQPTSKACPNSPAQRPPLPAPSAASPGNT